MYRPPGVKVGTLNDILGTRVKMEFPHRINISTSDWERFKEMKAWCESNCKGIYNAHSNYACYFQFTEEKDALLFALRWGVG